MSSTIESFESKAPDAKSAGHGRADPVRSMVKHFSAILSLTRGGLSSIGVIAILLAGASLVSVLVTYLILSGTSAFGIDRSVLLVLLGLNIAIVIAILPIIVWRVTRLWAARKAEEAGSKLHLRMVVLFSVIAIFPAIIVAIFSAVTLTLSLNSLLAEPVPTAIENSVKMAQYYMQGQSDRVESELQTLGSVLNANTALFEQSPIRFNQFLDFQIRSRDLLAAYIIDSNGTITARAQKPGAPPYEVPDARYLQIASDGGRPIFGTALEQGVAKEINGISKLAAYEDAYLLVKRETDPQVLDHSAQMKSFIVDYEGIEENRAFIELVFAVTYIVIALIVLLGAIWLGLRAATNMVAPVSQLMSAAEQVRDGNLSSRVSIDGDDDEMVRLGQTFNKMTEQIETQRNDLISANEMLDTRRRFTETVLGGVSAGVLGLNADGNITIANPSALKLLELTKQNLVGHNIADISPELSTAFRKALNHPEDAYVENLHLTINAKVRHLSIQVTSDNSEETDPGYVMTLDDITKLVSAQRTAAWADVARRIAHEIKNPLTPIQLSAERLQRKYAEEISSDPSIFEQCTDTIIRQVKDIGRMVDEFSSFARMPAPVIRNDEIVDLVKRSVFPQRVANPDIDYSLSLPNEKIDVECDGRLIGQALTNILKNAAEGIESKVSQLRETQGETDFRGAIDVNVEFNEHHIRICVEDNGCGFPTAERERLTEPYMTTRDKGTGLGLAIVKKILEDHSGQLILQDSERLGGASAVLYFPRSQPNADVKIKTPEEVET